MAISLDEAREKLEEVRKQLHRVFVGYDDLITCLLLCFISIGLTSTSHLITIGKTGTGKSRLSSLIAPLLGLTVNTIDGSGEPLPSDVIGYQDVRTGETILGPIFTNILRLEEVNRFHPRTRSAFLAPMAERRVTVQKETYILERPFLVFANENPASYGDTAPLRLQERDRFFLSFFLDWPNLKDLVEIIDINIRPPCEDPVMPQIFSKGDLVDIQEAVAKKIYVDRRVEMYGALVALQLVPKYSDIARVRTKEVIRDASLPRGARDLVIAARSFAYLCGKENYTTPEHIRWVAKFVLPHRIDAYTEALSQEEIGQLIEEACFMADKIMRMPESEIFERYK